MDNQLLFSDSSVFDVLEHQKREIKGKIYSLESNYILNTSENNLVQWLISELQLETPEILDSYIYVVENSESKFEKTDLFGDSYEAIGTKTVIAIPFTGDPKFFKIRPSSFTTVLPRANMMGKELRLTYEQVEANGDNIKQEYTKTLNQIKQYLSWLEVDVYHFNSDLENAIRKHISERKTKLLAGVGMLETLGLPIKRREDAAKTYVVPVSRQKPRIEKPQATTKSFKPEPTLLLEEYEKILSIMQNMVLVMEKSPHAFESMDEEALRTHFLVQLNAQYEGQATGETFNYHGKTDILISYEGRNVFIAECKFWHGEQKYSETIDQLLDRYLSWRDTKTAILVFNRNQNFTDVLKTIETVTPKHRCFKKYLGKSEETIFKYVFHQTEDVNREIQLAVMIYNIPIRNKEKVSL